MKELKKELRLYIAERWLLHWAICIVPEPYKTALMKAACDYFEATFKEKPNRPEPGKPEHKQDE